MKLEIIIDEQSEQPRLVIYTREITPEINDLVVRLSDAQPTHLIGYQEDRLELLQPEALLRIYADQQKVFAQTENGLYTLRLRLYEVEQRLTQPYFIRISNSEMVNFKKVRQLDMSLTGTICLYFHSGEKSFVSRRYMAKIKSYLGI
ncbi:MAG: LytTR family transcriptional regulator [Anaerolineae bacterium]|nr:LytTR family transcriptional regulator [Anaerolineae bacterium]